MPDSEEPTTDAWFPFVIVEGGNFGRQVLETKRERGKIRGTTRVRTWVPGNSLWAVVIKIPSDNHYTIVPWYDDCYNVISTIVRTHSSGREQWQNQA